MIVTYDKHTNEIISSKSIVCELPLFGGFYAGDQYNYIVYGDVNPKGDADVEEIRVVKYDKSFNKISHFSLSNYGINEPFHSGYVRMAEIGNQLLIHTSKTANIRAAMSGHQMQLSILLDTDTMTMINTWKSQYNHVSHSFNQFVLADEDKFVMLDHGDGYPRSVCLQIFEENINVDLFNMPGDIGANCTGILVGGFEQSKNNYLATINTIEHNKVSEYTSYEMIGLDKDERDVIILVQNKNLRDKTKHIKLTDYINHNKSASVPYLVKISDDKFAVLWHEFEFDGDKVNEECVLKGTTIDGEGNQLMGIKTFDGLLLNDDCQPAIIDGKLTWFVDYKRIENGVEHYKELYTIDVKDLAIGVELDGERITFDQDPILTNGRTLVPLRAIFEKLGAQVQWDAETQTVKATKGDTTITLTINDVTAYKNDESITLDVPGKIVNGRTLVPLRFVSDCFDTDVQWNAEYQKVILTTK
ncbi:MAG: copper amine oxidase N-terminal domain-containing protein [Clostridia bacterium]|nr:copper amine oxidase N-terminal domain-containing protein [Clostridia bacterium]